MIYSADYVTIEDESFEHSHNGFSTYLIIIYLKITIVTWGRDNMQRETFESLIIQ
jgi:hypothetical protein